ncbi:phosphatidylinositol-glycan biosynthesis class W protein-like [Bicyclus anynana]|uniref:Phosphatidylinositol-glycan biosynthesis class W protein n=1 Tax=Bicyclus anynana TaxID=110368 RepID=A0A6J1NHL4_BICAN|nr:phosphatidylinositol-glycan biosynthesis class W protein-like [Bicyclus anynana]
MNNSEYKNYHESFMQNNHGSTAVHTFLSVFFTVQCALFCAIKVPNHGLKQYVLEYIIIVLPTIVAHTVFSNYINELNLCVSVLLLYEILKNIKYSEVYDAFRCMNNFKNDKILSVSCLRGLTYLITVICILAVDFKDFPRHLAKTENYGYSLMDTGVGLFILISGLVHKEYSKQNYVSILKSNTKFVSILLILGVTRYLSIKQLDYQNHITEYGVHWNFFYTLAVCKFVSCLLLILPFDPLFLSITILSFHEFLLYKNLEAWVFSDTPRINLIDANKEGITSSLGYVALYLFAVKLKKILTNKSVTRYHVIQTLIISSVVLLISSYICNLYRPVSRTLANAGYSLYLSAITALVLSLMYVLEIVFGYKNISFHIPLILGAINDNGLLYFLIANVATGIINMSVRTLFVPAMATFVILNFYMILNISIIVYANRKGIKL